MYIYDVYVYIPIHVLSVLCMYIYIEIFVYIHIHVMSVSYLIKPGQNNLGPFILILFFCTLYRPRVSAWRAKTCCLTCAGS